MGGRVAGLRDGPDGSVIAVVSILFAIIVILAPYAVPACFLAGLLICVASTRQKVVIKNAKDLYREDELHSLLALRNKLQTFWNRKARIYQNADRLGLARRTKDTNRFREHRSE